MPLDERNFNLKNLISHSRVETIDGSANEGSDYVAVNEVLTFGPQETEQTVSGAGFNFLEKPGMLQLQRLNFWFQICPFCPRG